jgi:hypothetical protein
LEATIEIHHSDGSRDFHGLLYARAEYMGEKEIVLLNSTDRIVTVGSDGSIPLARGVTTGNRGWRTAKAQKRTANFLPCVFHRGARQRAHGSILHGKDPLPCAASDNAWQIIFAVRFSTAHGKKSN